jgi:hypothetical protein
MADSGREPLTQKFLNSGTESALIRGRFSGPPAPRQFPWRPVFSGTTAEAALSGLVGTPREEIQDIRELMAQFPGAIAKLPMRHHATLL